MNKIKLILMSLIVFAILISGGFVYQYRVNLLNSQFNVYSNQTQLMGTTLDPNLKFGLTDNNKTIEEKTTKIKTIITSTTERLTTEININNITLKSLTTLLNKLGISLSNIKLDQNNISLKTKEDQSALINTYQSYLQDAIRSRKTSNQYINPIWTVNTQEFVSKMSIEDLLGQVLMIGVDNTSLSPTQLTELKAFNPGGVILMGKNIVDQTQTINLNSQIQSTNPTYPLLITTDQEGGDVKRLPWENMKPQSQWLGTEPTTLCEQATSRASIMKSSGFNMNLAPVTDLSSLDKSAFINNRTISPNPKEVSKAIQDYRKCFDKTVFSTLKHFPGHGMVSGDSHKIVPTNSQVNYESWLNSDALPFKDNLDSQFILNAHILIPQVDNKITSLSKQWVEDILRYRLGYKGIAITDDMEQLRNITQGEPTQLAIEALEAGNDMLLYLPTANNLSSLKARLVERYSNNRSLIESKVIRIMSAKKLII